MSDEAGLYPESVQLVREVLLAGVDDLTGEQIGNETPADLDDRLPFVLITCTGGRDDRVTDLSRIDVDVFAATKDAASVLSRRIQQVLTGAGGHRTDAGVLDRAETDVRPRYQPYVDDPPPYRYLASYTAGARRRT